MRLGARRATALVVAFVALGTLPVLGAPAAHSDPGALLQQSSNGNVEVQGDAHHDSSKPLRDVPPINDTGKPKHTHEHELEIPRPAVSGPASDPALQQDAPTPSVATSSGVNVLGVGNGVPTYSVDSVPPDPNGAVGATQYVQWVNESFAVFDKATGARTYGPAAGNTLWSGFGGACQTDNDGDPIVAYDKAANRWVMSQIAVTGGPPFFECVAVSQTSDATGAYYRYAFQFQNFNDYPKLGVWPDAYYLSINSFQGNKFVGATACALDRSKMLVGAAATKQCFQEPTSVDSLLPADLDGSTPPPVGSPGYFVDLDFNTLNTLRLWRFHVDFATPANSTFTGPVTLSVAPFSPACGGGACMAQPGTTTKLDSLGDRLMHRLAYRNFGDHESLVVTHSVQPGNGAASGLRWYEIIDPNGTPKIVQQATFAPDTTARWMGSIAMDHVGDIALGYSASSATVSPAVRYTGRTNTDPLDTMQVETVIQAGAGSQNSNVSRWGDYSSMTVDPVDDCTFWYTNEYLPATGSFNWSTRIASFRFPGCTNAFVPPAAPVLTATAGNGSVHLSWSVPANGGSAITVYRIYRSTSSGTESFLVAPAGTGTTFDDNTVVNGTTYWYQVSAVNSAGEGLRSAEQSVTPPTVPAAPVLTATAGSGSVHLSWSVPANGGSAITGYRVYRSTSSGTESFLVAPVGTGTTFDDNTVVNGTTYWYQVSAVNSAGEGLRSAEKSATPQAPLNTYFPLVPARVLDTRTGNGAPLVPLGADASLDLVVTGRGGVPASGVSAVVLNVTVTNPTAPSFLTAWPTGVSRPVASNLNFVPGETIPNLVVVEVGSGGKVSVYNREGSTDVIADVVGYYATAAGGASYFPLVPARVLDTRTGNGAPLVPLGADASLDLVVTGRGGGAGEWGEAVVLNVTVTNPTAPGVSDCVADRCGPAGRAQSQLRPGRDDPEPCICRPGRCGRQDQCVQP